MYCCDKDYTWADYLPGLQALEKNYPAVYRTLFAELDSVEGLKQLQDKYPAIYEHFLLYELMEFKRDSICQETAQEL